MLLYVFGVDVIFAMKVFGCEVFAIKTLFVMAACYNYGCYMFFCNECWFNFEMGSLRIAFAMKLVRYACF